MTDSRSSVDGQPTAGASLMRLLYDENGAALRRAYTIPRSPMTASGRRRPGSSASSAS